jgi:hypothetical protein
MIYHVHDGLYVGNLKGYDDTDMDLQFLALTHKASPRGTFLHIDMIDAPDPKYFHHEQFRLGMEFISKAPTLVFCDLGGSRSPSMALVYLAKKGVISQTSYFSACRDFLKIYPYYKPNTGVRTFLAQEWLAL